MSAQTGLRPPPRRRHNNRLRGCPGGPGGPGEDTGAGTGAGAANNTRKSGRARKPKRAPLRRNCSLITVQTVPENTVASEIGFRPNTLF